MYKINAHIYKEITMLKTIIFSIISMFFLINIYSSYNNVKVELIEINTVFNKGDTLNNIIKNTKKEVVLFLFNNIENKTEYEVFDSENSYSEQFEIEILEKINESWKVKVDFTHSWKDENIEDIYHSCFLNEIIVIDNMTTKSFELREGCHFSIEMKLQ
jgi:hypothetical protein